MSVREALLRMLGRRAAKAVEQETPTLRQALLERSGSRPRSIAPDAGQLDADSAWREHLRAQGFDVDRPIYHGTASDFETFDPTRAGQVQKSDWGDGASYFTPSRSTADYYRGEAVKKADEAYNAAYQRYEEIERATTTWRGGTPTYSPEAEAALKEFQRIAAAIDRETGRGRIVEGYARTRNPAVINSAGMSWTDPNLAQSARTAGHDSVIIKNPHTGEIEELLLFNPQEDFAPLRGQVPAPVAPDGGQTGQMLSLPSGGDGMIRAGKPALTERLAFLLSTAGDERKYAIGKYLESRREGGAFGRGRWRRSGNYNNVYSRPPPEALAALLTGGALGGYSLREALQERFAT